MFEDIKEFHKKFNLEALYNPGFLSEDVMEFRIKFLEEELNEFIKAYEDNNLHDAFDALIDLTYVVLGTAYLMGLPFKLGWDDVHEANMAKVKVENSAQSKRGHSSDVIKPKGWLAPDLHKYLVPKIKSYICPIVKDCDYVNIPSTNCLHALNHIHIEDCDKTCGNSVVICKCNN